MKHAPNTERRCLVLYEVSLLTLPLLLVAPRRYAATYFVICPPVLAKYFGKAIIASGARQITEKDYLDGTYYEGRKRALAAGRRLGQAHPWLGQALAGHGRSDAYLRFADSLFCRAAEAEAFMSAFLERFFTDASARFDAIDFLSARSEQMFEWSNPLPPNVHGLRWLRRLLSPIFLCRRILEAGAFLAFPLANALRLLRKGIRFGALTPAPNSSFLLIHREAGLTDPSRHYYRDLYFLRSGALAARDCQHFLLATSQNFDQAKKAFLKNAGGHTVSCSELRFSPWDFWVRLPLRSYVAVLRITLGWLRCPIAKPRFFRDLLEVLHLQPLAAALIDYSRAPIVVCETEVSPFAQVAAIEARRLGRKTVSMIHGSGAQHTVGSTRFEMQIEDMITYGSWDEPLKEANPALRRCVPVGNIELDRLNRAGAWLPSEIRSRRETLHLVAFLARLSHVLTTSESSVTNSCYLDDAARRARNLEYLAPFFRWVAGRADVVLVWKTGLQGFADGATQTPDGTWTIRWQDWLAPLMADVPAERFIYIPEQRLEEVVAVCDLSICNDVSSAFACALSAGGAALSFDLVYGGMFRRYHPRLAATTGQELVENAEWLLQNPIPDDARRRFNQDFYNMPIPDFGARDRVCEYFRCLNSPGSTAHSRDFPLTASS